MKLRGLALAVVGASFLAVAVWLFADSLRAALGCFAATMAVFFAMHLWVDLDAWTREP